MWRRQNMEVAAVLMALVIPFAMHSIDAIIIELREYDDPKEALRTPICSVPVLGSTSEQLYTPKYQFSLGKGGTIKGSIGVVRVVDNNVSLALRKPEELAEVLKSGIFHSNANSAFKVRRRAFAEWNNQDHYNWFQLMYNLYKWVFCKDRRKNQDPLLAEDHVLSETEILDNVYILLMSKSKWDLYVSSLSEEHLQPAKGSNKFVVTSHVFADLRIPITALGKQETFIFQAEETDRFVLMLLNPDERKLVMKGEISFLNPGSDHLPMEMKHFKAVIVFWEVIYAISGILAFAYLLLRLRSDAQMVNYIMAINFAFVTLYLRLDTLLLDSIMKTGTYSNIVWTMTHVVKRLHENSLLATLVLLALGWKMGRENLSALEFRIVCSVTAFSCVVGFIEILIFGVDVSRNVVHTVAFISILIASNFNILMIRARIVDEPLNSDVGVAYAQLKAYNIFKIGFFVSVMKPELYSIVSAMCLQSSGEQNFIWDEHFMLFFDLFFDYLLYCLYFMAFMPAQQLPLFKHLFAGRRLAG
ncbi:uncharacterized protein BXIN_1545 [Babesia sp. Xinjiang]|uniref:uncharacterized protein n=1 Tax=Babesia sp. Xinjiang TaxID=462227 RepID=UPI000A26308D|nr:uncharacterized protein BXIN_1545 [Babesia sp. Xinjiang]ORM42302.1 hypothetical protein BXIN_1545 [Babesia sp. Xinjiang]